jgi:hypothetical protein
VSLSFGGFLLHVGPWRELWVLVVVRSLSVGGIVVSCVGLRVEREGFGK